VLRSYRDKKVVGVFIAFFSFLNLQETRTKPSVLTAKRSSTDNLLCVVEAGWVIVLVSPKFGSEHNLILSRKLFPLILL
jgi:hypothetical protein